MSDTTEAERMTRWIAEKVMGLQPDDLLGPPGWYFDRDGETVKFSPTTNPTDALDALEVWCERHAGRTWKMVRLDKGCGCRVWLRPLISDRVADTLALAICRALCSATGMPAEARE